LPAGSLPPAFVQTGLRGPLLQGGGSKGRGGRSLVRMLTRLRCSPLLPTHTTHPRAQVGGENLDNKFAALEGRSVDDELSALKKGMLSSGSSPVAALPEGRPLRDAIDMELDQLRRKARD